ncbi:Flagellar basal-body rod protein FlgG [bioreactor metagenome]|uniref:Flagellar basal-body rod protein FlgG n=1 Tax=bioreactor metagenome TaxID=1076179 RepID=A0A645AX41_9ZZZZ
MYKGFYTLSSSMLTQNRKLNVISNNLSNVSTPGYKSDELVSGTFKEGLLSRTSNNTLGARGESLGNTSMITVPYETVTDFSGGSLEDTGGILDFAIVGDGFFKVQSDNGPVYTRNGSFMIDDKGYLSLKGVGRVLSNNNPIFLPTDNINVESDGTITDGNGVQIAKLNVVEFDSIDGLKKTGKGVFSATGQEKVANTNLMWKYVETSNVDTISEMTAMLASQRTLQSAAQVLKIYDEISAKAANEIGKV